MIKILNFKRSASASKRIGYREMEVQNQNGWIVFSVSKECITNKFDPLSQEEKVQLAEFLLNSMGMSVADCLPQEHFDNE